MAVFGGLGVWILSRGVARTLVAGVGGFGFLAAYFVWRCAQMFSNGPNGHMPPGVQLVRALAALVAGASESLVFLTGLFGLTFFTSLLFAAAGATMWWLAFAVARTALMPYVSAVLYSSGDGDGSGGDGRRRRP